VTRLFPFVPSAPDAGIEVARAASALLRQSSCIEVTLAGMRLDAVILGGGVAGLWTLNELTRRGRSAVLLEPHALGTGQTVASQGILHGGTKYTLRGLLTPSAEAIAQLPALWRSCLRGESMPSLASTEVRADHCHLWHTRSLRSRAGMFGARIGLATAPQPIDDEQRPAALRDLQGRVMRLDEMVIDPVTLCRNLADPVADRVWKIDEATFEEGAVRVRTGERAATLTPRWVVLTAGEGNAILRRQLGLNEARMQRRPLHMVMARGPLPELNGHCVDGAHTRVTITTAYDAQGRTVWQVGGQLAEDGVTLERLPLLRRAIEELRATVPGLAADDAEWSSYRVDRAELATAQGKRPDTFSVLREDHVLTAWPTKLVSAPSLAKAVAENFTEVGENDELPRDWPRPPVAAPPWEQERHWRSTRDVDG
jgi:glycerol-3-phosphate dehydrogenase